MPRKPSSRKPAVRAATAPRKPAFLPFARPSIDEATVAAVGRVLRSGWITTGPQVEAFEAGLSSYLGGRAVRTFTSATGALEVALQACGIGPGDEVIVPAMTFAATSNVVLRVGARPVFADVELATRNIDLRRAEAVITPKTRAIMPVHFAGLAVDMDELYALAERRKLRVVEDAAHAIGTTHRGRRIGSFGDLVSFSFHPNKNLTTIEGGALSVRERSEVGLIERLRFHGIARGADGGLDVTEAGGKYNLTDVAACVGIGQLKQLERFNAKRRKLAARYFDRLGSDSGLLLPARGDAGHSWHMFAPLLPLERMRIGRAEFIAEMRQRGIGVGIHYPALHLLSLYRKMGHQEGDFPNAERIGKSTITLPLFPAMSETDVDRVCSACGDILARHRKGKS